jgi:uncharacterized protein (DUF362 family)
MELIANTRGELVDMRKTDRRDFIKSGLATTATLVAGGSIAVPAAAKVQAAGAPLVITARGTDPAANARAAVDALGGMKKFVKPGDKVVIKPNMSFARGPKEASNTNPAVVGEVARMCSEAGASRVSVLDYVLQSPRDCLSLSKIPEYCRSVPNTSVNVVQSERLFRKIGVPKGRQFQSMKAVTEVLDADVLIAVPVGKSHGSAGVSFSMKGMMGLIYDRRSFHTRYDLHDAIVDMVTVLKPDLVVSDGTRILSTGGPSGPGKVIPLNLVVASTDMVAADAQMLVLGTWYGRKFKPSQVKHIRLAAERGLGRMDLENLRLKNVRS